MQNESTEQMQEFMQVVGSFGCAMLATHSLDGEMRARPMVVAQVADDHALWLISDVHSEKIDELGKDARVSLTMQKDNMFASLSGKAEVVRDQSKVEELWSEPWRVWFPKGPQDSALVLLRVQPEHGEYWDNAGLSKAKYLMRAAKAYISGERPQMDASLHGKVNLS